MIVGRSAPPSAVAVVQPEATTETDELSRVLRGAGHKLTVVQGWGSVLRTVSPEPPALLIGWYSVDDPNLVSVVRTVRGSFDMPVLLVMSGETTDRTVEADEVIWEPLDPAELAVRVGQLLSAQAERRALKRRVQELLGLYRLSWSFSLTAGTEALIGQVAKQSAELLGAEKGLFLAFDPERRQVIAKQPGHGLNPGQVERCVYPVDGEARSRWNFRKNGPLISNKPSSDTRLLPEFVAMLEVSSVLISPLTLGTRFLGMLAVADRKGHGRFGDDDLNLLMAAAGEAAVALENARLHDELQKANDLLQEHDRVKSEFVAIVAHDFRRPLMAIRGYAELVLEDADLPLESRREFMKTVMDETDELAHLADDTLLITRMETGQFQYHWGELELGPFILETIPFGLSDHSLLLDIPQGFPKIVADRDRLRQVLTNLISNAVKYSPQGGEIVIRCRERGAFTQQVVIEVVDHGLGIPPDQVGRLFAKFQRVRTEEHMKISGTGLGLYICRLIVEGHNGQIWVESELGKGSTFGLVLPLDAQRAEEERKARPATRFVVP